MVGLGHGTRKSSLFYGQDCRQGKCRYVDYLEVDFGVFRLAPIRVDSFIPNFTLINASVGHETAKTGWIKMPLDTEVGLGPGHISLDGDPPPPKGAQPPIFGPCLLIPSGWMDQNATWYGGRPRLKPHCIRWEPAAWELLCRLFGPCLLWQNGRPSQLLLNSCSARLSMFT